MARFVRSAEPSVPNTRIRGVCVCVGVCGCVGVGGWVGGWAWVRNVWVRACRCVMCVSMNTTCTRTQQFLFFYFFYVFGLGVFLRGCVGTRTHQVCETYSSVSRSLLSVGGSLLSVEQVFFTHQV